MWHPWRALRRQPHVRLCWTALPPGVRGLSDGTRIWIDHRQLQSERRSTLAHELIHIERGHTGCVGAREESRVRRAAARRLIPFERLLEIAAWTEHPAEAAEELWVDLDTLHARLEALTPQERRTLARAQGEAP